MIEDKDPSRCCDLGERSPRVETSLTEPGRVRIITGRPASMALKSAMFTWGSHTPSALYPNSTRFTVSEEDKMNERS